MNEQYQKLTNYVNCAGYLADRVKHDVANNDGQITELTLKALARFVKAEQAAALLHDLMSNFDNKLN